MRRSRFGEEQIIAILREQEAGAATGEVCRRHGISDATEVLISCQEDFESRCSRALAVLHF
jgi:hypothetical protein